MAVSTSAIVMPSIPAIISEKDGPKVSYLKLTLLADLIVGGQDVFEELGIVRIECAGLCSLFEPQDLVRDIMLSLYFLSLAFSRVAIAGSRRDIPACCIGARGGGGAAPKEVVVVEVCP
jgi:hypothetical protein